VGDMGEIGEVGERDVEEGMGGEFDCEELGYAEGEETLD
jgi:hypothetical protein